MRLHPNRSTLEGQVLSLRRCSDGVGAELELTVSRCEAQPPAQDFIGATPGERLCAFTTLPEALAVGDAYRFDATVLGGPQGERVVLTHPRKLPGG